VTELQSPRWTRNVGSLSCKETWLCTQKCLAPFCFGCVAVAFPEVGQFWEERMLDKFYGSELALVGTGKEALFCTGLVVMI
jgi:hypothetical protein